jgi:pimeloyl-ACP methyl ester carboxylesterase
MPPTRPRPPRLPRLPALFLTLAAAGCADVTVHEVVAPDLLDAWRASAVAGDDVSPRTLQTLRRYDLETSYRLHTAEAADRLHALAVQDPQPDLLFALSEINYVLGRRAERLHGADAVGRYYLCAGYAWHFLFAACGDAPSPLPLSPGGRGESMSLPSPLGGEGLGVRGEAAGRAPPPLTPVDAFDPRFRLACDFYNAGLAKCIAAAQKVGKLDPRGELRVPAAGGAFRLSVVHVGFPWRSEEFGPLLFCDDYAVGGLTNHYHGYGLGVPLIGTRAAGAPPPEHNYYPEKVSFPVTAFFRFEGGLAELGERRTGRLELYNPLSVQAVEVRGRSVPLETDLTTPLAYYLAHSDLHGLEYLGFFRVDSVRAQSGVHMLEPYQPGKIPVVFVHGLLSSPLTWAPVINDLRADPVLRDKYQFWVYFYPTGAPYLATAADLRDALDRLRHDVDPGRHDQALDDMVFVGHSMGGLISHLLTVDSGDDFWREACDVSFDSLKLKPQTRDELRRVFFFERRPYVKRVVFLGTPHRGSRLSPSPAGRLAESLVRLPKDLMDAAADAAAENPDLSRKAKRLPTSVDLLDPSSPALELLMAKPRSPDVHYHSVVGMAPPGTTFVERLALFGHPEGGDGVVSYESAHFEGAESELIVPADHFHVHQHALAVLEVRRILLEHCKAIK